MFFRLIKSNIASALLVLCASSYADITINIDSEAIDSGEVDYSNISNAIDSGNIVVNIDGEEYHPNKNRHKNHYSDSSLDNDTFTANRRVSNSQNKKKYAPLIAEAAEKHHVDPKLLHAVIQAESSYNPTAMSSAGAVGLMQLMPATARRFGVTDRNDPIQNVEGGARYLKHLIKLFDSDLNLALAAYNAGENAVVRNNYSIPPYAETQHYVKQVLSLQKRMKRSDGGSESTSDSGAANIYEWNDSNGSEYVWP